MKAVVAVLVLVLVGCAVQPQVKTAHTKLDVQSLATLLAELFPGRDYAASYSYAGFLRDLHHFQITTVGQLREIVVKNWDFAQAQEKARNALYSVPERGYFYNSVGMARNALRNHLGDAIYSDYELQKSGYLERLKKPNQAVQPTPGSVTPPATSSTSR